MPSVALHDARPEPNNTVARPPCVQKCWWSLGLGAVEREAGCEWVAGPGASGWWGRVRTCGGRLLPMELRVPTAMACAAHTGTRRYTSAGSQQMVSTKSARGQDKVGQRSARSLHHTMPHHAVAREPTPMGLFCAPAHSPPYAAARWLTGGTGSQRLCAASPAPTAHEQKNRHRVRAAR